MSDFKMDAYIDVATRIAEFRKLYPEGTLQPADPAEPYRILTTDAGTFLVVVAAAYRTPDDPRPGIGMAQEQIPGRTPYTKGSELQNAETSAWGRAIVAVGAADTKKGVASADEVRNRQAERDHPEPVTDTAWMEAFQARVDLCTKPSELRGLVAEAQLQYADGKLTREDAVRLKGVTDAREKELTAEPVSV